MLVASVEVAVKSALAVELVDEFAIEADADRVAELLRVDMTDVAPRRSCLAAAAAWGSPWRRLSVGGV